MRSKIAKSLIRPVVAKLSLNKQQTHVKDFNGSLAVKHVFLRKSNKTYTKRILKTWGLRIYYFCDFCLQSNRLLLIKTFRVAHHCTNSAPHISHQFLHSLKYESKKSVPESIWGIKWKSSFHLHFTQISTFSLARDFLVAKGGFLSQSEVSEENCHFKFVFTQITSFSIAIDFVAASAAVLSKFEVSSKNPHFKSIFYTSEHF